MARDTTSQFRGLPESERRARSAPRYTGDTRVRPSSGDWTLRRLSFLFMIATLSRVALATDFAPTLQWVTALGPARSLVTAAASDGHGNLYVTGSHATAGGNIDAFVAKLDIDGNIIYSATLGGNGNDTPVALAAASDGSLFVTGSTGSTDFPVTPGAYLTQSAIVNGTRTNFVVKL